jgi:tRNA threonylcarbamoyl adenosine modification protein (Sua5/YciO/YrdC/YwlC family)
VSELFQLGPGSDPSSDEAIETAARAVRSSELVVVPTDTVYGVGARPDRKKATARLFATKGRPRSLTLPVLVADVGDAERVGVLDERARILAGTFWPGGLTLVLRRAELARRWDLGDEKDTVGVRMPDHHVALDLLRTTGPLAVTSANVSGEPTPSDCPGVRALFGQEVAVYLCAGPVGGVASTVVDLSGPEPRILREGAIPSPDLVRALE